MLLHIEIVAGMTGENQWDVIPPGKRETKAATHKRMVDMNYVHPLEKVTAARINPDRQMISGIGNGYAGQTDDIALVLNIRVLIRNKEIDLFSPAVEMLSFSKPTWLTTPLMCGL